MAPSTNIATRTASPPDRRGRGQAADDPLRRVLIGGMAAALLCALHGVRAAMADETGQGAARSGSGDWPIPAGSYLRDTLGQWSGSAGWTLIWDSPLDYRIRAGGRFTGRFEDAVTRLVDAVHRGNPELSVTLYRGNRVVHVVTVPVETR